MSRLVGYWEITHVSEFLEGLLRDGIFQCRNSNAEQWAVDFVQYVELLNFDAPQCFVAPAMTPCPSVALYVPAWNLQRSAIHHSVWLLATQNYPRQPWPQVLRLTSPLVVIFGRDYHSSRWKVVYAGLHPYDDCYPKETCRGPSKGKFCQDLMSVEGQACSSAYCVMRGSLPSENRQVMTLWYHKWMIFDRYGTLSPYIRLHVVPEPKQRARSSAAATRMVNLSQIASIFEICLCSCLEITMATPAANTWCIQTQCFPLKYHS